MSDDWKSRIDAKLETQRAEEERKRKDRERKQQLEDQRQNDREEKEHQRKLDKHNRKFRCHIRGCTNHSAGPARGSRLQSPIHLPGEENYDFFDDWNNPTNMNKCNICHKWTCPEHLHEGICMYCA